MADIEATPEQVYYDKNGIQVTDSALRVMGDSYSIASIQNVDVRVQKPDRTRPILCLLAGILLSILGVGVVLVVIGAYWWFSQKSVYWLNIQTRTRSETVHRSSDGQTINELKAALSTAITYSQIRTSVLRAARAKAGKLSMSDAIAATGSKSTEVQIVLNKLIQSECTMVVHDQQTGEKVYDLRPLLEGMMELMTLARDRQGELSLREALSDSGFGVAKVQLLLNSLIEGGYLTSMKDTYGETLYRFKD